MINGSTLEHSTPSREPLPVVVVNSDDVKVTGGGTTVPNPISVTGDLQTSPVDVSNSVIQVSNRVDIEGNNSYPVYTVVIDPVVVSGNLTAGLDPVEVAGIAGAPIAIDGGNPIPVLVELNGPQPVDIATQSGGAVTVDGLVNVQTSGVPGVVEVVGPTGNPVEVMGSGGSPVLTSDVTVGGVIVSGGGASPLSVTPSAPDGLPIQGGNTSPVNVQSAGVPGAVIVVGASGQAVATMPNPVWTNAEISRWDINAASGSNQLINLSAWTPSEMNRIDAINVHMAVTSYGGVPPTGGTLRLRATLPGTSYSIWLTDVIDFGDLDPAVAAPGWPLWIRSLVPMYPGFVPQPFSRIYVETMGFVGASIADYIATSWWTSVRFAGAS